MAVSYKPLEVTLIKKNLSRQKLREAGVVSGNTLAKLRKGEYIALEIVERLCSYLDCDITDVLQIISDNSKNTVA